MQKIFHGAGVALVTPFQSNLQVDFDSLGGIVDAQIENGMDFLVVLGTTGEPATLSDTEKQQVIDFVIARNDRRVPVMVGVGGNNTAEVIEKLKSIDLSRADGILSVVPY